MKLYFESYGCTLNRGESEKVKDLVIEKGHVVVENMQNADVLIIFTCTVIETTERKMLKRLKAFSKTNKRVIVGGCMASIQKEKVLECISNAEFLSPKKLTDIIKLIGKGNVFEKKSELLQNNSIGIVPIAIGCLGNCSYCITRLARGKLKSRNIQEIINDVEKFVNNGFREIQITAQDTACYGKDIGTTLPELVNTLTTLNGEFRLRIGMMNPSTTLPIIDDLIKAYKSKKVFKFLHLPLQSGDNEILKLMNRGYRVKDFLKIIDSFRKNYNDLTFSTDIIVGFPNENEESFKETLEIIKKIKPDIVNITRFSKRENTRASKLKAPHGRISKARSRILTKLRFEISKEINEKFIGKTKRVLVTEIGKNNTMIGRTNCYKQVVFNGNTDLGKFIDIRIIGAENAYLKGKLA